MTKKMAILNKRLLWIICWVPVLAACGVFGAEEPQEPQDLVEIEVIHTATMNPDATDPVIFVTATLAGNVSRESSVPARKPETKTTAAADRDAPLA